MPQKDAPPL